MYLYELKNNSLHRFLGGRNMCKKLKPNFTFVKGFLLCLFIFILGVIAFFGFKSYPEVFSDIGITQFFDNLFHKNENVEENTLNTENNNIEKNSVETNNSQTL